MMMIFIILIVMMIIIILIMMMMMTVPGRGEAWVGGSRACRRRYSAARSTGRAKVGSWIVPSSFPSLSPSFLKAGSRMEKGVWEPAGQSPHPLCASSSRAPFEELPEVISRRFTALGVLTGPITAVVA
jgi:hypothetical protein